MEGREHWEKAGGTGKVRNQWGSTTLDMSIGPSAQGGQTGPAGSKCVIKVVIKEKTRYSLFSF